MSVIALIPARAGSKGIPGKNFRLLDGRPLYAWALTCAHEAGASEIVLSTDFYSDGDDPIALIHGKFSFIYLHRPAELAQDDTPMIDVVTHALAQIPGDPDDVIVLLQPTQPFRKPAHITEAIRLLRETQADSVVSVVELPSTHNAHAQLGIWKGRLEGFIDSSEFPNFLNRQERLEAYIRDGTVYAFTRETVKQYGTIYGHDVCPLIVDPADSCSLDSEADWNEVVRRWSDAAVSHPA